MTITPGPWKASAMSVGTDEDDSQVICYMSDHRNRQRREYTEHKANARLIAAAPELLAVLRSLLREDGHYIGCPCPGDYSHEHMPNNEIVKLCARMQAVIACAETGKE